MSQMTEPPILNRLPYDIVLNILTRLPVKSVIRLRCVSKSLYSSITTPYFISTHLNHTKNNINRDNACVIHLPYSSRPAIPACTVALDRSFDTISEIRIPFDFPHPRAQIVGSCNGLLCLADLVYGNVIYLWNPSVRKFKKLPDPCLGNSKFVKMGFAYHSENNDYKVVRILSPPSSPQVVEVYTLSLGSWRRFEVSLGANGVYYYFRRSLLPTPFVSGALHWIAGEGEEYPKDRMIVSFDVNSEKFRKLALPPGHIIDAKNLETHISSFKGKLAFIRSEYPGRVFSIWVMREYGVVDSWTKLFVVPFQKITHCTAFTEYGSLLVFSYIYTNRIKSGQKFVLVDIETLQEKNDLGIQISLSAATFMESLVLLDGANVVSY
ncbi:F-box protein CPR1-like [Quercus lobata]|uniref:F-box domain-containing protein n=1 Tax=Quercus lobata TaxID=97700 RepID=A0A7N2LGK6_QUELO|nr:F-box protein CPR1-like [Quercus lobata]